MKIIISVAVALFLIGCSDDGSKRAAKQDIFKEPAKIVESVEIAKELKGTAPEVAPVAVEIVEESNTIVVEETIEVLEVAKTEVIAAKSGADLFKVCSSCHGINGEKKALNKSQIIQGWSEIQVTTALNGYKDGSYGGAMKGLMKSQVTKLSDEDIATLSKYISEL